MAMHIHVVKVLLYAASENVQSQSRLDYTQDQTIYLKHKDYLWQVAITPVRNQIASIIIAISVCRAILCMKLYV